MPEAAVIPGSFRSSALTAALIAGSAVGTGSDAVVGLGVQVSVSAELWVLVRSGWWLHAPSPLATSARSAPETEHLERRNMALYLLVESRMRDCGDGRIVHDAARRGHAR